MKFNLIYKDYVSGLVSDRILNTLLYEVLKIQLIRLENFSLLSLAREAQFKELKELSFYYNAIDIMQNRGEISEFEVATLKNAVLFAYSEYNRLNIVEIDNDSDKDYLEAQRITIRDYVLSLLEVFKRLDIMGKKKRMKLWFLYSRIDLRKKAIEIINNQRKDRSKLYEIAPIDNLIPFPACEDPQYKHWKYGWFDELLDPYTQQTLIVHDYVRQVKGIRDADCLELTDRGRKLVLELSDQDSLFKTFLGIARQLQPYFDDMNGTTLEHFLKEQVDPDYDQIERGRYYE